MRLQTAVWSAQFHSVHTYYIMNKQCASSAKDRETQEKNESGDR